MGGVDGIVIALDLLAASRGELVGAGVLGGGLGEDHHGPALGGKRVGWGYLRDRHRR